MIAFFNTMNFSSAFYLNFEALHWRLRLSKEISATKKMTPQAITSGLTALLAEF